MCSPGAAAFLGFWTGAHTANLHHVGGATMSGCPVARDTHPAPLGLNLG